MIAKININQKNVLTSSEIVAHDIRFNTNDPFYMKGYIAHQHRVSLLSANTISFFLMLPFSAIVVFLWHFFTKEKEICIPKVGMAGMILCLILFCFLHEMIHGISFAVFSKDHFSSVKFGIYWKYLAPYTTCVSPLKRSRYLLAVAMPTLILGFGMATAGILLRNLFLFFFSVLMIHGGGADFHLILSILFSADSSKESLYVDHPYEHGFICYTKEAPSDVQ